MKFFGEGFWGMKPGSKPEEEKPAVQPVPGTVLLVKDKIYTLLRVSSDGRVFAIEGISNADDLDKEGEGELMDWKPSDLWQYAKDALD